jgi:2-dehydro-3-deoxyphosphogluconate aldolase/(4S)-4-hydroxy-2-oxoglutarate aldolase
MMSVWEESVERSGVIAILRNGSEEFIEAHLDRFVTAGLSVVEVSQTSPSYEASLRRLVEGWSKRMHIGAGTILTVEDAECALDAGATFLVSPHFDAGLARYIVSRGIPYVAGCLTPSEIVQASHAGVTAIKIFPASFGGPEYIKALLAPLPGIRLVPTGGVTLENATDYWKAGAWAVGIGSELSHATAANGWTTERLNTFFQRVRKNG